MSKEIEAQVKAKLKILHELVPDDSTYYRGTVDIAYDYIQAGCRREMIDLLRRVPTDYFQGPDFRRHCQDLSFLAKAEDMAYFVLSFRSTGEVDGSN